MIDGSSEDPNLAEEHCDQQGGAGRVGCGGQQMGHPGGHCEHGCGHEVDEEVLPVPTDQVYMQAYHRKPLILIVPRQDSSLLLLQVASVDIIPIDINRRIH